MVQQHEDHRQWAVSSIPVGSPLTLRTFQVTEVCISAFELCKSLSKVDTHVLLVQCVWIPTAKGLNRFDVANVVLVRNAEFDQRFPGVRTHMTTVINSGPVMRLHGTFVRVLVLGMKDKAATKGISSIMCPSYGERQLKRVTYDPDWRATLKAKTPKIGYLNGD